MVEGPKIPNEELVDKYTMMAATQLGLAALERHRVYGTGIPLMGDAEVDARVRKALGEPTTNSDVPELVRK